MLTVQSHLVMIHSNSIGVIMMNELNQMLKLQWGSERWIFEGYNRISDAEKALIHSRMNKIFCNGLPFKLKHHKLFYIYTFSMLAQLEVLAIQIPLKFEEKMSSNKLKKLMRAQLLDEIFHGMVFTKIVYMLSSPLALPPKYNDDIEKICNFIRDEECPKVAVVLLNLIGEGWIEEIFKSLRDAQIAPVIFDTIIEDEHRHVSEALLYQEIGLPNRDILCSKLQFLEKELLTNLFFQYNYVVSTSTLLGVDGVIQFLRNLNKKHEEQLSKISLSPSDDWTFLMQSAEDFFPKIQTYAKSQREIEKTPMRQVFMTQWGNPSDPTMVGQFDIDISSLDFFNKKYPKESLTILMLQTISSTLDANDSFRNFLTYDKLYQSQHAYTGLIVKLPDCNDHIGTIVFENCHLKTMQELNYAIRTILQQMVFCYKKREQLEKEHPILKNSLDEILDGFRDLYYPSPLLGNSVVSLSNIGFCGYSQAKSPLRTNEALKFTLLQVERKPKWNEETNKFEPKEMLPISISADHRIFDGNLAIPHLIESNFKIMFNKMITESPKELTLHQKNEDFIETLDKVLATNLEIGYKILCFLQTYWVDNVPIEDIMDHHLIKDIMVENN